MSAPLAFYPSRNSRGKHDGDYFAALAEHWVRINGGGAVCVDLGQTREQRARQVVAAVERDAPEVVAFFCHGLRSCLPQMGIASVSVPSLDLVRNVDVFAGALAAGSTHPRVALFACSCGDDLIPGVGGAPGGDGGFADQLRDSLVKHGACGAQVDAHDRAGDSVHNPYVRRFSGPEDKAHVGGFWLVDRADPVRWARWEAYLHRGGWAKFPLLSQAELHSELESPP